MISDQFYVLIGWDIGMIKGYRPKIEKYLVLTAGFL